MQFTDTDASGRIHFTAAFRYVELAETELRRRLGIMDDWELYPRRHVEADYLAALAFDDEVEITIEPAALGRTSITWAWTVEHAGRPAITGRHTVVKVDAAGRPESLPETVRVALAD